MDGEMPPASEKKKTALHPHEADIARRIMDGELPLDIAPKKLLSNPSVGASIKKSTVALDPEEAELVRRILDGEVPEEVCIFLRARGCIFMFVRVCA